MTEYVNIKIDGVNIVFPSDDQLPVIVNDRTLVPVRWIFEHMGFNVDWSEETETATLVNESYTVAITIGSHSFTVNGQSLDLICWEMEQAQR